ncbi:MAG: ClbS/DfsB family four-helix bundle protein, partial [Gammaproteobacteria bacterium]|nr:ClbS/DfsB family four-helix bundle protein [Gammaproteobacteria bacterium]
LRFIQWYQAGLRGEIPEIPAPGMTWRDLPKLNRLIYEKYQHKPLAEVL